MTFLTAALDPNPPDFRGDVSCQNGILLLVAVNERRHLGHGCAIDHRREPDGDTDWNPRGDKAVSQPRGETKRFPPLNSRPFLHENVTELFNLRALLRFAPLFFSKLRKQITLEQIALERGKETRSNN